MGTSFVILALVMSSPFSGSTALKGGEALHQLTDFEKQYRADATKDGKKINIVEYRAAVKQKANDLLTGFDSASVAPSESMDWVHVLDAANRYQDSLTVLDRFIASKPSADDVVSAKIAEVTEFRQLKETDKIQPLLESLKPTNEKNATQIASQDGGQAQMIARGPGGEDAALKFLDGVTPNFTGYEAAAKVLKSARANILAPSLREKLVGSDAPELKAKPEMYGTYTNLAALKGKVVILDFFAHWCPPCKASMPDTRKMSDELGDKLQVVGVTGYYGYFGAKQGIDQKEEFADMKGFMDEFKIDHPVVYIDRGDFAQYGATGIPEFVLIGKDGKVKNIQIGYSAESFAAFRKLVEAEVAK